MFVDITKKCWHDNFKLVKDPVVVYIPEYRNAYLLHTMKDNTVGCWSFEIDQDLQIYNPDQDDFVHSHSHGRDGNSIDQYTFKDKSELIQFYSKFKKGSIYTNYKGTL